MDDWQLLESYGRDDSQDAFTELVKRHVNLVYSVALRQVREPELARDVTQLVFSNLARRAKSLKPRGTLTGWLYRDASLRSREILRRERRRIVREQEAVAMQDGKTEMSQDWLRIEPGLDAALSQLGQTDRDAVLLRFFEQRSLKEIGSALGMEEDAARKRVSRALEKLRMLLAKKKITTTSAALSLALATHAVQAAPAGLAAGVLTTSLTAGSTAVKGTTTLIEWFTMTTKVKATVAAVAVAASAGTPLIVQHQTNKSLRAENQALLAQTSQLAALQAENEQLSARVIQASNTSLSDEQRLELTRLRGVASRAIRAEAELAQLKSALSARRTSSTGPAPDPNSSTGALLAYLGEAVPPPPDIDPAYSQNGLLNAVQEAARVAGVSLKRVEIETSEFPFLAGVVCDSAVDFKKLTAQFKNMPNYEFGASTGGDEICAFDLTPYRNLPAQAEQRIRRRTSIRTQLLYDQLK